MLVRYSLVKVTRQIIMIICTVGILFSGRLFLARIRPGAGQSHRAHSDRIRERQTRHVYTRLQSKCLIPAVADKRF